MIEPGGKLNQDTSGMNVIFVHSSLDDAGLSAYAFRIYCHIARRANQTGHAWPGIESIAKVCGISKNTVKGAIAELEERQMLKVIRSEGGRHSNRYFLTRAAVWTNTPGQEMTRSGDDRVTECTAPGQEMTGRGSGEGSEGNPSRKSNEVNPDIGNRSELRPENQEPPDDDITTEIKAMLRDPKFLIQSSVHKWFKRRANTKWSKIEDKALTELAKAYATVPLDELREDLDILEWYYTISGCEFLRRDVKTLLNNWQGEIDRAKEYK